jgi:hypothetical protein
MTPAAPSPDALRIGRLDRVLDQLGEQRVAISHAGLSVSELADRVARLEAGAAADAAALAPLRELDAPAELAALRAAVEALQRDAAASARHAAEARVAGELRLQAAEARAAAAEVALRQVEAGAAGAAAEQAAALDELRGATKGMLSEVVRRIAEQFDAVQGALEAAIAERAGERSEAAAAAAATAAALGRHEAGLAAAAGAADAARALRADLDALAAAAAAAEARAAAGAAAAAEAAAAWRAGLEARLAELPCRRLATTAASPPVRAAAHSAALNGVAGRLVALGCSPDTAPEAEPLAAAGLPPAEIDAAFDVVVANILAGPLVALAPRLALYARDGAALGLSGVTAAQAAGVAAAYAPWFERLEVEVDAGGAWALVSGVRRAR